MKKQIFVVFFLLSSSVFAANPVVCVNTNMGNFCMELYESEAPLTVANFLNYVRDGDYNSSFFHRSVANFVIQGGGFTINNSLEVGVVPTDPTIKNEYSLANIRGTVAMAKGNNPDSATSQWFVNLIDNSLNLGSNNNGGYTVFAKILDEDMPLIDKIAALPVEDLNLGANFITTPLTGYDGGSTITRDNFVFIESVVIASIDEKEKLASYTTNQKLSIRVDAGNLGKFDVSLNLIDQQFYDFQLDVNSLVAVSDQVQTNAVYNPETGILTMEKVEIDNQTMITDVELTQADKNQFIFRLSRLNGNAIVQLK